MVAAILTILGYSTNDKVVVYDRVRENLRKYKTMPLRDLIDLSINETLNRTLGTSMTVFLASLPLALFGGESISGFAWVMLFGIVVGTSSSIFIAAPILLFLGENRLRREAAPVAAPKARTAPRRDPPAPSADRRDARSWRPGRRGPSETLALLVGARAGSGTGRAGARPSCRSSRAICRTRRFDVRNIQGSAGLAAAQALAEAAPTGAVLGWVATPTLPARMVDRGADDLLQRIILLGAVQKEPICHRLAGRHPAGFRAGHRRARQPTTPRRCRWARRRPAARRISRRCGCRRSPARGSTSWPSHRPRRRARRRSPATSPPPRSACRTRSATCARGGWSGLGIAADEPRRRLPRHAAAARFGTGPVRGDLSRPGGAGRPAEAIGGAAAAGHAGGGRRSRVPRTGRQPAGSSPAGSTAPPGRPRPRPSAPNWRKLWATEPWLQEGAG